jgi:hypothetical protein
VAGFFDSVFGQSESNYEIAFQPVYGKSILHLGETFYRLNNRDSFQIQALKFYISAIEFLKDAKIVWKEESSFHLMDAENVQQVKLLLKIPPSVHFTDVEFNIGIDSLTNVSGAMGGDLDPTKGMYWTWQSGYINFKIEGKSNLCDTRNHEFQFHIGGYEYPFNALQTLHFKVSNENQLNILIAVDEILKAINLTNQNHIMSPSLEAVTISNIFSQAFILQGK